VLRRIRPALKKFAKIASTFKQVLIMRKCGSLVLFVSFFSNLKVLRLNIFWECDTTGTGQGFLHDVIGAREKIQRTIPLFFLVKN